MPTIFVDESGSFTKSQNGYFVVAAFSTDTPALTDKRFRSWQQTKFPKKLRNISEVKFSEEGIDDKLRRKTIQYIASLDICICYTCLLLKNIPTDYRYRDGLKEGLLYTHLVVQTIKMFSFTNDEYYQILCDRRSLKGLRGREFSRELISRIQADMPQGSRFEVKMVDSTSTANIQIADWIAGALAAYVNGKSDSESYYRYLQDVILVTKNPSD